MRRKDERVNLALRRRRSEAGVSESLTRIPSVTADDLVLIKTTIAKDATDAELALFLHDCARQGVHPLDKLIHFTKRAGKYTPVTGIDFLRIRAAEAGDCVGIDDPVFTGTPATGSFEARVTVYRLVQGQRAAFTATARWTEYKPDQDFAWKKMPHVMLGKCAEALALRKGFPKSLHGLYVSEELEQAGNTSPAPFQQSLKPSPAPVVTGSAVSVSHPEPAVGAAAVPADLAPQIDTIARVAAETRKNTKGYPVTQWTIALGSGRSVITFDRDHADRALVAKHDDRPVALTTKTTQRGAEILTLTRLPDDAP
jgi:phage recombination protein Bet